jgi:hypothetical protein
LGRGVDALATDIHPGCFHFDGAVRLEIVCNLFEPVANAGRRRECGFLERIEAGLTLQG